MTYEIKQSSKFKKDLARCIRRGLDLNKFSEVIDLLKNGSSLPEKYRDHPLQPSKEFIDCRELHIEPDWLLVYKYSNESVILYLVRTGTHSDLFGH